MEISKTFEIIRWEYGFCQPAIEGVVIGVSIIISVKIFVSFILSLKRKKDARMDRQ